MPPYHLARLSEEQLMKIESLENEIGVTLVAYAPEGAGAPEETTQRFHVGEEQRDLIDDALLDTYRTYDPLI